MADSNPDLDLGKAPEEEAKSGGGNFKLIIIVAVAALALGGGAAWFMLPPAEAPASADQSTEPDSEAADESPAEAEEAVPEAPVAIYHELGQDFIANLPDHHLVKVVASVMSYEQEAIDQVKYHKAAISHEVLSLLRAESYEALSTAEGQEAMRTAIKDKIQSIIRRSDSEPGIEEVYLTDFIIQ